MQHNTPLSEIDRVEIIRSKLESNSTPSDTPARFRHHNKLVTIDKELSPDLLFRIEVFDPQAGVTSFIFIDPAGKVDAGSYRTFPDNNRPLPQNVEITKEFVDSVLRSIRNQDRLTSEEYDRLLGIPDVGRTSLSEQAREWWRQ